MSPTTENKKEDSLKKRSIWLLTAKMVGFFFSFALPLLTVRFLDQSEVGLYRISFQMIINLTAILPLGFSMSSFYFLTREKERRDASIFNILLFNFVVGGLTFLTFLIYPQFLGEIFQNQEVVALAPKIGLIIWIWIFSTFLETVAIANQETRLATAFIVFAQFSKTLLMVGAVFFFSTVEAFLYAAMIQGAVQTIILMVYLNSRFPHLWKSFQSKFFVEQAVYALPFGMSAVLWILQNDVHNYFVAHKFSLAEYAVYAYGCFQLPFIGMLTESVASVMIPRVVELKEKSDNQAIIEITAKAMQKLALFYFPIYLFMLLTADTFITTLFTKDYSASIPIFMINLSLLPFSIVLTDPIVRADKDLGRVLVIFRVVSVAFLLAILYLLIESLSMVGVISISVAFLLIEMLTVQVFVGWRIGVGRKDVHLLKDVGKTAVITLLAGAVTFVFYSYANPFLHFWGERFAADILLISKPTILNFIGGSLTLFVTGLVFLPIYAFGIYAWNVLEESEIEQLKGILRKFKKLFFRKEAIQNPHSQPIK